MKVQSSAGMMRAGGSTYKMAGDRYLTYVGRKVWLLLLSAGLPVCSQSMVKWLLLE
jgi:hypothetical protein